ncbi:hypothetical protein FB566_1711 [Stackebrandtia endophytica]|uniref:DUF3885 domain-containing protein n=1 Tax=Stackebrandtia endophytica TaxID=1496996 RepID=A0A543AUF2_9ACTN|nr:hypothetical protein [Stackebrandtia endophytica]TQL76189.1 hypothetical protein FB566_1711 [Stackebrandtia endophytica]
MSEMEGRQLDDLWRRRRSAGPPIGHLLRSQYPDVWVRFHSLPQSRRYPENEADYTELLHRHNTVATELFADTEVLLVRSMFRPTDVVPETADFAHWSSVMIQDDPDPLFRSWSRLFWRWLHWRWGVLDTLLREVADDREGGLCVTDVEPRRIYRPYDGGACAVGVVDRTGPTAPPQPQPAVSSPVRPMNRRSTCSLSTCHHLMVYPGTES